MKLSDIPKDKFYHFVAGALICALVGVTFGLRMGLLAGVVAGALKEFPVDWGLARWNLAHSRPAGHDVDVKDFMATVLGTLAMAVFAHAVGLR